MAAEDLSSPPIPPVDQSLRRQNAQAILLQNLKSLRPNSLHNQQIYGSYFDPHVLWYEGEPESFVSGLSKPPELNQFMEAKGTQLSTLQPKLEFSIWESDGKGVVTETPVIFSDYVSGEKMVELAKLRGNASVETITSPASSLGTNVGIRSFSWTYDNKSQGDYVVKASLELHFGSMLELLNKNYLEFIFTTGVPSLAGNIKNKANSNQDAEIAKLQQELNERLGFMARGGISPAMDAAVLRPTKKLKLVCGWSVPDTQADLLSEEFKDAVALTQRTMFLGLSKYEIDFLEEGQVNLKLDYYTSIDSLLTSKRANVLDGKAKYNASNRGIALIPYEDLKDYTPFPDGYVSTKMKSDAERPFLIQDLGDKDTAVNVGASPHGGKAPVFYKAFSSTMEGIEYEIKWLEDKITLLNLTYKKKGDVSVTETYDRGESIEDISMSELIKLYEGYLDAALKAATVAQTYLRAQKYASLMEELIDSGKVFLAFARYGDLNRQNRDLQTFKNLIVQTGRPLTDLQAHYLKKRLGSAARAEVYKKETESAADMVARSGLLDPRPSKMGTKSIENDTEMVLPYMRFGDLIAVALRNTGLIEDPDTAYKFMIGSFDPASMGLTNSHPLGYEYNISLAEIPISVEYFGQWFVDNIISSQVTTYTMRRFIQDMLDQLITPILNNVVEGVTNPISLGYTVTSFPRHSFNQALQTSPLGLRSGKIASSRVLAESLAFPINGNSIETVLIFTRQLGKYRSGNVAEDREDGIFHFYLGADVGIQKSFSFTEQAVPYIRAQNISNANKGSYSNVLILPQNVEINMVGNSFFPNGSTIYVNAELGLGTAAANTLGLGGYYQVVKSSNSIEPGAFNTTLTCIRTAGMVGSTFTKGSG